MSDHAPIWRISSARSLALDRPRVVGIINATPDSFSDGGDHLRVDDALRAAERMFADGADILDIGGESTRPGALRVDADEQIARVVPVIAAIRREFQNTAILSVDTTISAVAARALDAGADIINDVSAGSDDASMLALAAARSCAIVLMHRLHAPALDSYSTRYNQAPDYDALGGVVHAVKNFLASRAAMAIAAGVHPSAIALDPGLGFGKSVAQNLELIARTRDLTTLGHPVYVGISRKSFTAVAAGLLKDTPPKDRLMASIGLATHNLSTGARIFRVHDVREHVLALRAAWASISAVPASLPTLPRTQPTSGA